MARPPDPVRRQELLDQVVRYLADHGLARRLAAARWPRRSGSASTASSTTSAPRPTCSSPRSPAPTSCSSARARAGWPATRPSRRPTCCASGGGGSTPRPSTSPSSAWAWRPRRSTPRAAGVPGQVRAEQVGLWRTDIEQRLVAEGLSPSAAQVEASLVKAMFTGLVVDLIATGNRRRLTRALREGLHRLEAVVAAARAGAAEQPARARPLGPPGAPCEPADLSPLVLVSGSHAGGADR